MAKNTKTLSADVIKLSEEVRRLTAELAKTKKGTLDYTVANNKLIKALNETIKASKTLDERTKNLSATNRTHVQSINAAAKAQQNFNSAVKDASSTMKTVSSGGGFFDKFLGSFSAQKLGSTLGTVVRFLGVGGAVFTAINALKQVSVEAFKTFVRLEQSFASLSAVSEATAQQMKNFRKQTFEVAVATGYTADEVIQLQTSLVKLGVPIDDVSSSMQSIAIASRAMGEDLSNVGETVFRVSNQFGLSTQEIAATSSILVRAVNESALTFEEFGTAIQYVGPVAKQAGLDFNETAGYMQVLSNAGFRASKIGTGLRDIFIDLKQPGETLTQTINRLSKENIGLSEAVDLVGKTSASQLLVLMRNSEELEKFANVSSQIIKIQEDLSSLLIQNSKNLNTTQGRINALGSAWESYTFRIGEAITGTEFLLDLIGLLDTRTEQAARAVPSLAGATSGQLQSAVSKTRQQRSPVSGAIGLLSPEALEVLTKEAERTQRSLDSLLKSLLNGQADYLKAYGAGTRNAAQEFIGIARALSQEANKVNLSAEALTIRRQQFAKFSSEFADVEAATGKKRIQLAESLRKKLEAEEDRLQAKLEKSSTEEEKRKNEIQLNAAKDRSQQLAELVSGDEKRLEDADKKRADADRKLKKSQDDEAARLKDLIELRKREYQELVDSLEIDKELALAKGDLNEAARIEALLIKTRSKSYTELTEAISQNKIITADQKFDLLGNIKDFKVNEKDIKESVENIAKVYKEAISAKGVMQGVQVGDALVEQFILSLENSIGELPESEKKKIRDLINLLVFPDTATDLKTSKGKGKLGIDSDDFKVELAKAIQGVAEEVYEGLREISDVKFENLIGGLEREKDAIKERYDYEQQVLEAQVENQLITQEEYERKLEQIQKRRIQKENQINKKIFESEQKRDRKDAGLEFAETLASLSLNNFKKYDTTSALILTAIGAAAAGTQYGLKVSAINQRQFFPVRFAEGGLVNGPSHAAGGVPFSVQGRGGYEMEGGEFIINKEATKRNYSLLKNINDSVRPSKYSTGRKFASGGLVNAEEMSMRQVELLESIAKATGGTYINTAKPVRAFVATEDLRKSDVDLRIRERNSNL